MADDSQVPYPNSDAEREQALMAQLEQQFAGLPIIEGPEEAVHQFYVFNTFIRGFGAKVLVEHLTDLFPWYSGPNDPPTDEQNALFQSFTDTQAVDMLADWIKVASRLTGMWCVMHGLTEPITFLVWMPCHQGLTEVTLDLASSAGPRPEPFQPR